jgi:hypothetical protein
LWIVYELTQNKETSKKEKFIVVAMIEHWRYDMESVDVNDMAMLVE